MNPGSPPFRPDALLVHREWVERTARALVFGDADAGDVAQQAWLEILSRPPASHPERPRGWLRTILRFKAIDAGRAARTRRAHEEAAARREEAGGDPAAIVAQAETLERVVHAVLALEEPYRGTVLLRYFKDHPPREIAALQGVPVETVRTRLKRALASLRGRLDGESGGDRRTWCLALLPLTSRSVLGGAAVAGGVLMGGKAKATAAAALLLLLAAGLLLLVPGQDGGPSGTRSPDLADAAAAAPRGVGELPPAAASADPTPAVGEPAPPEGGVRGVLLLPQGGALTATLARDGIPVAERSLEEGEFAFRYKRSPTDPGAFTLDLSRPGLKPLRLPLPSAETDVGTVRMGQGILYGGRVEDAQGNPLPGIRVAFLWTYNVMGLSAPTGADGRFSIPMDVEVHLPAFAADAAGRWEIATLLPLARGVDFTPVPAEARGLRGEHVLRVSPGPGERLRLLDGESGAPLPGWEVRLSTIHGVGASTDPVHPVFDAGVTDAAGVFAPLWADGGDSVVLEARCGSRRVVAVLDRRAMKGKGTTDVAIPSAEKAAVVAIRVLRGDGVTPAPGISIQTGWRFGLGRDGGGGGLRGTTDAAGMFLREVVDPDPLRRDPAVITFVRLLHAGEDGRPVMEEVLAPGPRIGSPVSREHPLEVRTGSGKRTEATWLRIREAGSGRDLVPVRIFSSHRANITSAYLFTDGVLRDADGHLLWPAFGIPWHGWQGEPPLESLRFEVLALGRAPRWFDVPVEEFLRARASSEPLLLEFPREEGEEIRVQVVPADGVPRAGIVTTLSWIPRGRPDGWWEKTAQCTTDAGGCARFVLVDPLVRYGVVAMDPGTGEAGALPDAKPGEATLRLSAPRDLAFRATLPDGEVPESPVARLRDPFFVLPERGAMATEGGQFLFTGVAVSLYELQVQGRGPRRPLAELDTSLVIGPADDPTPPGADPRAPRTTVLYGERVPADGAGPVIVLR